jgi:hypothetical protein
MNCSPVRSIKIQVCKCVSGLLLDYSLYCVSIVILFYILFLLMYLGFFGCDPVVFMKVLRALEKQNKCIIIEGETSEEDGVKFT